MTTDQRPLPLDPTRVRGLVFDLDGTLIDSYGAIAESLNHARRRYGLEALREDVVRSHVGRGLEHLVADLVGENRVEAGVRLFRECYARVYAEGTRILPGVADCLDELHRAGVRLSVASNKPARFGSAILDSLGMREYFRAVHGPDTAGSTKPDPAMIRLCVRDMGVRLEEAAYVGDMVLDVESGETAGLPVVLVPGGSSSAGELRGTGRTCLESIRELPGLLL